MTPAEFGEARLKLGLSQSEFARLLGMDGAHADDNIRRYETGRRTIPGPVGLLTQALLDGWRPQSQSEGTYNRCPEGP